MSPITHADSEDVPRLIDEFIPSVAAVIQDIGVGFEDPVREPVIAHELLCSQSIHLAMRDRPGRLTPAPEDEAIARCRRQDR